MLQSFIEMIGDIATIIAQGAVGYIADHSNLKKDGWLFYLIKFMVSVLVYLVVIIGIPLAVISVVIVIFNFAFST